MAQQNQPESTPETTQPQDPNAISIELSEEIAEGEYANLAMIAHSNSEFVIDFIRLMPGLPKAKVKSRIILTPEHAKRLVAALNENIERFEKTNGTIKEQPNEGPLYPMGFGGKMGEA
ncbi:DUF3467 domain-containing protein [Hymenobacter pini]|uniref:DUF3467 domain-containing protein n=1 Tax=Hymenobacter pini TaxID=2880879 RepID=UPI001CF1CADB|nr:DUF3467 domain-containing protein [Hymenobacter pini]MCA8831734.1 DUF3467 domain-containing protein [Hymenobacter pini]